MSLAGAFAKIRRLLRAAVTGDLSGATAPSSHHAVHWGTVLACLLGVTGLVHLLEASPALLGYRYGMFQLLSRLGPQHYAFRDVVVATVDDATYWQGEPAGRVPTDRRYLAKLLHRIAEAEPRLIALDFDLRSPDAQGKIRSAQKADAAEADAAEKTHAADETKPPDEAKADLPSPLDLPVHEAQLDESIELFRAADETAAVAPVVLPCTVKHEGESYRAVSDADDGFPFASPRVTHGYLQLAEDRRVIPPVLYLNDDAMVDSFSLAIVRQVAPQLLEERPPADKALADTALVDKAPAEHAEPSKQDPHDMKYASFVPRDRIPTATTSELFAESPEVAAAALEKLRGKVVLIGADWHSRALDDGPLIDAHPSPVGLLPGVMLHANYVESVLQGKFVTPAGMWAATIAEWLVTALVAFLLIAQIGWRAKLAWFVGIVAAYPLMSFFGMRLLGVYTDVLLLTAALVLHLIADVPTRLIHLTHRVKQLEGRLAGRGGTKH